jgi:hypothetical protein
VNGRHGKDLQAPAFLILQHDFGNVNSGMKITTMQLNGYPTSLPQIPHQAPRLHSYKKGTHPEI